MTERLYYHDAALDEFTAHIVARQEDGRGPTVRLDRTAFYPTSGGQPCDTGTIDGIPVMDVWEGEEGAVWHLLERIPDGEEVAGRIDWPRRFDHMQQHTGQHLLSQAFIRKVDAHTLGFHIGSEASTIDLETPDLSWEDAFRVEDAVNGVVWENRPVTVHFATQDELAGFPLRRPPQVVGTVRIVQVEGYDASACGGTHVGRTGEVGGVKITGIERYKGGVRATFLCGGRALRDYRRALRLVQQVSADLSTSQDALCEAVARIQEEMKTMRRALNEARGELMQIEADRLWEEAPEAEGVRRIIAHWEDRSFADARTVAVQLRARPLTLALLAVTEPKGVQFVCARSDDLPDVDASAILRTAAGALGGRGGGSPAMAQGGAGHHSHEAVLDALRQAVKRV